METSCGVRNRSEITGAAVRNTLACKPWPWGPGPGALALALVQERRLTEALSASAVGEELRDPPQLPLLPTAKGVEVSLTRDQGHVVVAFWKETQTLKEE